MKRAVPALAFACLVALAAPTLATPWLEDNFDDNSLDPAKWWVNTTGIPQNPKSVNEANGHIELEGRAHLNTVEQIDPLLHSAIEITGRWTFVSGDDMFQILTRSDGQPGGSWGETDNGIEFYAFGANNDFSIRPRGAAAVSNLVVDRHLGISAGDTFDFVIRDGRGGLSFLLTEVGDPSSWAYATATSASDMALDYIVFHNREDGRRSNLDDVTVQIIPEPASLALLGAGLLALVRRRRKV